jgi:hypothetical protein
MKDNVEAMKMIDRLKSMYPDKVSDIESLEASLEGESMDEEKAEPSDELPEEDLGEMDDHASAEEDSAAPEDMKDPKKKKMMASMFA